MQDYQLVAFGLSMLFALLSLVAIWVCRREVEVIEGPHPDVVMRKASFTKVMAVQVGVVDVPFAASAMVLGKLPTYVPLTGLVAVCMLRYWLTRSLAASLRRGAVPPFILTVVGHLVFFWALIAKGVT